jgi:outer membrane protein
MRALLAALFVLAISTPPAGAQEPTDEWIFGENGEDLVLEVGGGLRVLPEYESADTYKVRPWPVIELHYIRVPVIGGIGGGPETGFSFSPSFRVIEERDDDDFSDLAGLGDVDLAVELGGEVAYRYGMFRALAAVRHGFGGHHGIVGRFGVDAVMHPIDRLTMSLGPRLFFASDDYLNTYLGVTPAQSASSGLPVYELDNWIRGVGAEADFKYRLTPRWSVVGEAGYERLVFDAADSPVTARGSKNQFAAALGLSYRFHFDLFD